MHATPEDLFRYLETLGIETRTYEHPPVFTVAESRRLRGELPGGHCKCLFLRDKKGQLFLVAALESRTIVLKDLRQRLGARRSLSFASPSTLQEVLGVEPGAVTPFALLNDRQNRVTAVLDEKMLDVSPLNYHPLRNNRTTAIDPEDLVRFLRSCGHDPIFLGFPAGP